MVFKTTANFVQGLSMLWEKVHPSTKGHFLSRWRKGTRNMANIGIILYFPKVFLSSFQLYLSGCTNCNSLYSTIYISSWPSQSGSSLSLIPSPSSSRSSTSGIPSLSSSWSTANEIYIRNEFEGFHRKYFWFSFNLSFRQLNVIFPLIRMSQEKKLFLVKSLSPETI